MIIYDNEYQFNKWVCNKVESLDKFMSELVGLTYGEVNCVDWSPETARTYGNFVISVNKAGDTTIYNTKTGKSGKARRNPNDTMYQFLGLALAWARYNKKEIPVVKTTVKVSNLKVGDVVDLGIKETVIVLSIVPIKEKDVAVTLMSWNGEKSSFYGGTTKTLIMNKLGSVSVINHVNL
ncbi:MAG: hypothetical protein J6W35_07045 [Eubacterium sp.]|nr:hypothetical protein [Eubacterium sp.]